MRTIMLVDNEPKIVDILSEFFALKGFGVKKAHSGLDALEILKHNVVDLVILDEKMPVMTGAQFLKEMRVNFGEIPVILLTGSVDMPEIERSMHGMYSEALFKPAYLSEVLNSVNRVLK